MLVADDEVSLPALQARARSPWGRTALIIHGLAWAFGAATWLILASGWLDEQESAGACCVGVAASGVLLLWSLRLSLRALVEGEGLRFPVLVFVMVLLPILFVTAISGRMWFDDVSITPWLDEFESFAILLGLPLFMPFGLVACATAGVFGWALTSWWRRRDAGRRDATNSGEPNERQILARKRWLRQWLAWSALVFGSVTLMFLPFLLYLYCAVIEDPSTGRQYRTPGREWRSSAIRVMPVYVKTVVDQALATSSSRTLKNWHCQVIVYGDLPNHTIARYLIDTDSGKCGSAWFRGLHVDRCIPLPLAVSVGEGRTSVPIGVERLARAYLAAYAPSDDIRAYLRSAQSQRTPFLAGIVSCLPLRRDKREFVADLTTLASGGSPNRAEALDALIHVATVEERARLWADFAKDPDPARRLQAARAMYEFRLHNPALWAEAFERLLPFYVADENVLLRRLAVFELAAVTNPVGYQTDHKSQLLYANVLAELLDDPDIGVRRTAAWVLKGIVPGFGPLVSTPLVKGSTTTNGFFSALAEVPAPETQAEIAERKQVRAAAQKWLQSQKALTATRQK